MKRYYLLGLANFIERKLTEFPEILVNNWEYINYFKNSWWVINYYVLHRHYVIFYDYFN